MGRRGRLSALVVMSFCFLATTNDLVCWFVWHPVKLASDDNPQRADATPPPAPHS